MQKSIIIKIFEIFHQIDPTPRTELIYTNHYTLLVSIILSAQATDISVNKATKDLFKRYNTAKSMLELGETGLKSFIKTIGLYNSKASNVIKMSKILLEDYNNIIPRTREELMKLPGVGRKTANVFLNCAYGEKTIGVDTHVHRVSNRLGLVKSSNILQTEEQLEKKIPEKYKQYAHHHLILHGRYICKARKPECKSCKIIDLCRYKSKEL